MNINMQGLNFLSSSGSKAAADRMARQQKRDDTIAFLEKQKDNLKNMFYRRQTFNLFSEEPEYEYINPKTGEIVTSTDPNLCDKLNAELEKMKNKNKPRRNGGGRRSKIETAKVVITLDFSKMKFKF